MDPLVYAKITTQTKIKQRSAYFFFFALFGALIGLSPSFIALSDYIGFGVVFAGLMLLFFVLWSRNPKFVLFSCIVYPLSVFSLYYFSSALVFEFNLYTTLFPVIFFTVLLFLFGKNLSGSVIAMLEVAGRAVKSDQDGYTNRPYPTGQFEYTRDEAIAYAKWLYRNMTASYYLHEDKVVLVYNNGLLRLMPFIKPNLEKCTYAVLDFDGNVTVRIHEKHYNLYKEELTFDQLCRAFADLVMLCFRFHREGQPFSIKQEIYHFGEAPIKGEESPS